MSRRHALILLAFIVLFGFVARASTFKSPLLDHHGWRQADTAAIARNFYRERFNPLYPQVDWRGPQAHGYVETGLELSAFIVAGISKAAGRFHPEAGRVLSALAFIPSCLLVWSFVRRRYGEPHAMAGAFVYAFGLPLLLYIERAFMNEALLITLSLACLVGTQRYLERPRLSWWLLVVAGSALIGAIKLPYLLVLWPIAGLFVEARGWRAFASWELWVMGLVDAGAAAAWYTHARGLAETTGLTFGFGTKVLDWDLALSGRYVTKLWQRLVRDLLGPIALAAFAAGLALAVVRRRWCEIVGVAGFVVYLLIVPAGNFAHDYYQLPVMPIAVSLIALALGELHTRLSGAPHPVTHSPIQIFPRSRLPHPDTMLAVVLMLMALSTFVRFASFHSWLFFAPQDIAFCAAAQASSAPDERVVFVAEFADPKFLFCIDRKGWVLSEGDVALEQVRLARDEGATMLFVARNRDLGAVEAFARDHGQELPLAGPFRVFALRR